MPAVVSSFFLIAVLAFDYELLLFRSNRFQFPLQYDFHLSLLSNAGRESLPGQRSRLHNYVPVWRGSDDGERGIVGVTNYHALSPFS